MGLTGKCGVAVGMVALWLNAEQAGAKQRSSCSGIPSVERALAGTGIGLGRGGPFVAARPANKRRHLNRVIAALPLAPPLGDFRISSPFGLRRDPFNGQLAVHEGLDLAAEMGSPVRASGAGRVVFVGIQAGYGRMVELDHGNGVHSRYGHLSAMGVQVGQLVAVGQTLGLVGDTGRSTGPHLHYEVRVNDRPRDPERFLRAGETLISRNVLLSKGRLRCGSRAAPNNRGCLCP